MSFWQFCENSVDVDAQWANTFGLGTLWKFWWCVKKLATRTIWSTVGSIFAISARTVTVFAFTTWAFAIIAAT
jgi:hypothetical protein